jgi:thymidylate synthase ThyX
MLVSDEGKNKALLDCARSFVGARPDYEFTPLEKMALMPFFTNGNKKVFFVHGLPASVVSALLAMYSRLKNPRGLRGHFVDNLLPFLLTTLLRKFNQSQAQTKEIANYLKENNLDTLDKFFSFDVEHADAFAEFLSNSRLNSKFMRKLADSPKIKAFLGIYLDAYGHNSIARTANLVLGIEDVSILTAKSLEWCRPGVGYIELSTRYVDFSKNAFYPIEREVAIFDESLADRVAVVIHQHAEYYRQLFSEGAGAYGILPAFFTGLFEDRIDSKDLKGAAFGEACDVAANVLPCATLTSLGISISGEAFPELLKHLMLDDTYENQALAELILSESEKVGGGHFARHLNVSDWRRGSWSYLENHSFRERDLLLPNDLVENLLWDLFRDAKEFKRCRDFKEVLRKLQLLKRESHDKLPNQFEFVNAGFARKISFRSWRDIHRQGFCTHLRTLVNPRLGFYRYDKPMPPELQKIFDDAWLSDASIYRQMMIKDVPEVLCQYPMAMGNLVGFQIGGNLLQWEFLNWQRTKFSVNHEVRQIVLSIEKALRCQYPWWSEISRADMTQAYICARGSKGIELLMNNPAV